MKHLNIEGSGNTDQPEDSGHGNPPPKDPPKTGTSGFEAEQKAPEA